MENTEAVYAYEVFLLDNDGVIVAVVGTNDEPKAMRDYQRYVDEARGFGGSVSFIDNVNEKEMTVWC